MLFGRGTTCPARVSPVRGLYVPAGPRGRLFALPDPATSERRRVAVHPRLGVRLRGVAHHRLDSRPRGSVMRTRFGVGRSVGRAVMADAGAGWAVSLHWTARPHPPARRGAVL